MKSGFYPYCGPAGKDNSLRPYPKWYYDNADGAGITVHSVEEYLYAVDSCYRRLFSGRFAMKKPELWFLGFESEKCVLIPAIVGKKTQDEKTLIEKFNEEAKPEGELPYPQLLLLMQKKSVPTRLLECSVNAVTALWCAACGSENNKNYNKASNAAVWCLSPAGINHVIENFDLKSPVFDLADKKTDALFDGSTGRPFAVYSKNGENKSAYVVFPREAAVPLEKLEGSAAYLFKIIVPQDSCPFILEQLRRYGLISTAK